MPLVASVGPARRALKRTLCESLDLYHQVKRWSNTGQTTLVKHCRSNINGQTLVNRTLCESLDRFHLIKTGQTFVTENWQNIPGQLVAGE